MNKNEHYNWNKEDFNNLLTSWMEYAFFDSNPNFTERVFEIRSGMNPRTVVKPVDMNTYKKSIIYDIGSDVRSFGEHVELVEPTEEELGLNRFLDGPHKGRKVTRVLTEISRNSKISQRSGDQRLDFFHKLRREDNEYYIENSPTALLEAFIDITTCYSPGGENQSAILKFLVSPYIYIARNKQETVRMTLYVDYSNKKVFMHRVYGEYDYMFALALVKHFKDLGFAFVKYLDHYFDDSLLNYRDSDGFYYIEHVEFLEGEFHSCEQDEGLVYLWEKPDWIEANVDALTGLPMEAGRETLYTTDTNIHDSSYGGHILGEGEAYCSECSEIIDADDFDHDYEMCVHCIENRNWCDSCGDFVDNYYFDHDSGYCDGCTEQYFSECQECGGYVSDSDFNFIHQMCDLCVDNELLECKVCENSFREDEGFYENEEMCKSCVDAAEDDMKTILLKDFINTLSIDKPVIYYGFHTSEIYELEIATESMLDRYVMSIEPIFKNNEPMLFVGLWDRDLISQSTPQKKIRCWEARVMKIYYEEIKENSRNILIDYGVATAEEIELVTDINGYNQETLEDILFSRTGHRTFEQLREERDNE